MWIKVISVLYMLGCKKLNIVQKHWECAQLATARRILPTLHVLVFIHIENNCSISKSILCIVYLMYLLYVMCFSVTACHTSETTATGTFRGQYIISIHEQNRKNEKRTSGFLVNWQKLYLMGLDDWSDLAQCYASCLVSKSTKPQIKPLISSIPCVQITNGMQLSWTPKFYAS